MKTIKVSIEICSTCNGNGTIDSRVTDYDSEDIQCHRCLGSGRVFHEVIERPFTKEYDNHSNERRLK